MSREPLKADRWASASAEARLEGGQRVNGAQTVEARARSGSKGRRQVIRLLCLTSIDVSYVLAVTSNNGKAHTGSETRV